MEEVVMMKEVLVVVVMKVLVEVVGPRRLRLAVAVLVLVLVMKVVVEVVGLRRLRLAVARGMWWWCCWNVRLGVVELRDIPLQQRVDSPPLAALPPFYLSFCQL
jgi:hypothetical protein